MFRLALLLATGGVASFPDELAAMTVRTLPAAAAWRCCPPCGTYRAWSLRLL